MFKISERQRPVFSLTQITELSIVVKKVFNSSLLKYEALEKIDLASSARINEINSQIFLVKEKNWQFFFENYKTYINSSNLVENTLNAISDLYETDTRLIKPGDKDAEKKINSSPRHLLYDFREDSKCNKLVPSGEYLCIFDYDKPPSDAVCYTGFNTNIWIEFALNRYEIKQTDLNFAIGIVKI